MPPISSHTARSQDLRPGNRARTGVALSVLTLALLPSPGAAQSGTAIFKDADLQLGESLMAEHNCQACHVRRVGGDGSSIYRPNGRINTPGFLRGMVEQCNTELRLGLFPEEVTAIAAVLQRDHYRFKH